MKKSKHNIFHYLFTFIYYVMKGLLSSVFWIAIGFAGYYIFKSHKSPYDLAVGLPLLIVSAGFVINDIGSDLLSLFSPKYNRGVCIFCNPKYKED